MGEMRERMLRGELYIADDAENEAEFGQVQEPLEGVVVRPPFVCEYGNIRIGGRTFVNVDAVVLDIAPVAIGAACQIATRAVVTKDLPAGVVAAGVPARNLREIGDRDRVEVPAT